jgi:hypothetical protein
MVDAPFRLIEFCILTLQLKLYLSLQKFPAVYHTFSFSGGVVSTNGTNGTSNAKTKAH